MANNSDGAFVGILRPVGGFFQVSIIELMIDFGPSVLHIDYLRRCLANQALSRAAAEREREKSPLLAVSYLSIIELNIDIGGRVFYISIICGDVWRIRRSAGPPLRERERKEPLKYRFPMRCIDNYRLTRMGGCINYR